MCHDGVRAREDTTTTKRKGSKVVSTGIATTFYLPKPLIEKLEALRDEAWEAELEGKGYSTRRKPGLSEFVRELIDKLPEPKRSNSDAVDAEKMPQAKVLDPEG